MQTPGARNRPFYPGATRADDLAAILYTSGTTGADQKGAMLKPRKFVVSNAADAGRGMGGSRRGCALACVAIFHTHGLFVATNVALADRAGDDLACLALRWRR